MKLWVTAVAVGVASSAALAPASQAAPVCNERENSPKGYVVSGHSYEQMQVSKGKGNGLDRAAQNSPALAPCPTPSNGGSTGGGDTGGGDTGGDGGGGGIGLF